MAEKQGLRTNLKALADEGNAVACIELGKAAALAGHMADAEMYFGRAGAAGAELFRSLKHLRRLEAKPLRRKLIGVSSAMGLTLGGIAGGLLRAEFIAEVAAWSLPSVLALVWLIALGLFYWKRITEQGCFVVAAACAILAGGWLGLGYAVGWSAMAGVFLGAGAGGLIGFLLGCLLALLVLSTPSRALLERCGFSTSD